MSFLRLNLDTLSMIVEYLDCYDALRLSEVARPIHVLAKYQALKFVDIHSYTALVKFSRHMLDHMSHRLPYLLSIGAILPPVPSRYVPAVSRAARHFRLVQEFHAAGSTFADLLERATNLQRFTLTPAEVWMEYEPRIACALSSLRWLKDIQLMDVGPMVAYTLNNLKSKPNRLSLAEFQSASQHLTHSQFPLNKDLCLPSVRHLVAWGDNALPFFTRFASICPELRTLDLGSSWSTDRFPVDYTGDEGTAKWRHLECVYGLPDALEELPTDAPIHRIRLTHAGASPQARARLLVVHTAQPVSLSLAITLEDGFDLLEHALKASPRLRHFCLRLVDWPGTPSLSSFLVSTMQLLAGSSVVCLELRDCAAHDPGLRQSAEENDDLRSVLQPVSVASPALQFLLVSIPPRADRVHEALPGKQYWWRIHGLGAERVVEPLDAERGARISEYLSSPAYDCTVAFDESMVP